MAYEREDLEGNWKEALEAAIKFKTMKRAVWLCWFYISSGEFTVAEAQTELKHMQQQVEDWSMGEKLPRWVKSD